MHGLILLNKKKTDRMHIILNSKFKAWLLNTNFTIFSVTTNIYMLRTRYTKVSKWVYICNDARMSCCCVAYVNLITFLKSTYIISEISM